MSVISCSEGSLQRVCDAVVQTDFQDRPCSVLLSVKGWSAGDGQAEPMISGDAAL